MNKIACRPIATCWLITCACMFAPALQVTAQQTTIYGKFNWSMYSTRGMPGSVASAKASHGNIVVQGNLTQNTYKITGVTSVSGLLPGMKISGTGIPGNATLVDISGTTLLISRMITAASATGVPLAINNGNATLATAHADGLGGNLPGFATCTLDSGINYVFNGATLTPFPEAANASAARMYAGKLTVSANTSINKQVYVSDTLTLAAGNLTIPPADSLIIMSGTAIAGSPFSSAKHIITSVNGNSQGFLGVYNINTTYLLPLGTAASYLPVTLGAAAGDAFIVSAFEGITTNGQPAGTAFTPQQKDKLVDAAWTILRVGSSTGSCSVSLGWPQALEGSSFSICDSIGIMAYDTAWSGASGTGDNTMNTATASFTGFYAFSLGRKGDMPGALRLFTPAPKVDRKPPRPAEELVRGRIYPNPASDWLTIEYPLSPGPVLITMYDMYGRAIHKEYTHTGKTQLRIASLKAGVYTITISDRGNTVSKKMVKAK